MKGLIIFATLTLSLAAHSQVKAAKIEESVNDKTGTRYVTESDEVDITGDPAPIASEAKKNWKAACDHWKKEFRDSNADAKIINITCGDVTCTGAVGDKTCVSKASYKIKTRED